MKKLIKVSTGIEGLDNVIDSLRIGDNVVWQVDTIEDYAFYARLFVEEALRNNRKVVYMRFAQHLDILEGMEGITTFKLDAYGGFDAFSSQVYSIATSTGEEVMYVFDCLSELLSAWATDLMTGNFFTLTCPYLFELNTVAYFAILRKSHSFKTVARIRETTQLLLDLYNKEGHFYVHPLKVWNRYSPTMFLPHIQKNNDWVPVSSSVDLSGLLSSFYFTEANNVNRNLDYWDRLFLHAYEINKDSGKGIASADKHEMLKKLCRLVIGRDERVLELAGKFLRLEDLLNIKSRLIGSGYIGGKAAGMLIARAILRTDGKCLWTEYLEAHDSFYIGSDVFHSYIVENRLWIIRMEQRSGEGYFKRAAQLRDGIINGHFPDEIKEQFRQMLEYFGQSPIIVRSSSLLEDGFGNAFAGKYESIFIANQGSPSERYLNLENAVRKVYSSIMDENALIYREKRGLQGADEQMALIIQRVSGSRHKKFFFPDISGIGLSYNTYVWKKEMNPKWGMVRLVYGLGTRAVERTEADYARIAALDMPLIRPVVGNEEAARYSQKNIDVLNLVENRYETLGVAEVCSDYEGYALKLIGRPDNPAAERMKQLGIKEPVPWILDFNNLFNNTDFSYLMNRMLKIIENGYGCHVDIEFTVNVSKDGRLHINLLQCRPFQTKGIITDKIIPGNIDVQKQLFISHGNFMGGNILKRINTIVYVNPFEYFKKDISGRYETARKVGTINREITNKDSGIMYIGPGRWGTTTPSMGVPVNFSEINNASILMEVLFKHEGFIPELSFGSHFFQDLVEADIFYIALNESEKGVSIVKTLEEKISSGEVELNKLSDDVVRVFSVFSPLYIASDISEQKVVCFFEV